MTDARIFAPSASRNREPILEVLRDHLPAHGVVLEVASGTGEHVVHFAAGLPGLIFQPSDIDTDRRHSVDAWARAEGLENIRRAIGLDATQPWSSIELGGPFDAVICINMVHIAPWGASQGLIEGASRVLEPDGSLILYGPYRRDGEHTSPSNEMFDADLRACNETWGIRDLETVTEAATGAGFAEPHVIGMPANNLCLVFRKRSG